MASGLRSSTITASGHSNSARFDRQQPSSSSSSSSSHSARGVSGHGLTNNAVNRPKVPPSKRSVTPNTRSRSLSSCEFEDSDRVRVAVRIRPRNAEESLPDSDFVDYIELQPELKRLKLRKNNWSSEAYRFDEIFTESSSQRRVYEAVAQPVVESVLNGYNGTVMAYGQTGTGKTYTLGSLGKDDTAERGIMTRALEDILSRIDPAFDSVEVSYLQLYMESVQDLLAPEKNNIPINDDPKTGEVSLPGVTLIKLRDLDHFLQLLQIGEVNRHAANTKLNTESSRSHAILMVHVRRPVREHIREGISSDSNSVPMVRKSKLLIVDLAGSERIDKSGSEGHMLEEAKFINLSLTSLGKCINALAENSPHIPFRESKLTRLLRDSFGGSARTSLIITIGPSTRYHAETTSTIMFGQRAIKIVNTVKVKEDFDYESLCRKLESQIDLLTAEVERHQKSRDDDKKELEEKLSKRKDSFAEAKKNLITRSEFLEAENTSLELKVKDCLEELNHLRDQNEFMSNKVDQLEVSLSNSKQNQLESSTYQKELVDTTQVYEKKISELRKQFEAERAHNATVEEEFNITKKLLNDGQANVKVYEKNISELRKHFEAERARNATVEEELNITKKLLHDGQANLMQREIESSRYQKALSDATKRYEHGIEKLTKQLENERIRCDGLEEQLDSANKLFSDTQTSMKKETEELKVKLQEMYQLNLEALDELRFLKSEHNDLLETKAAETQELLSIRERFQLEEQQRKTVENELEKLKKALSKNDGDSEDKKWQRKESIHKANKSFGSPTRDGLSGQRATIAKICEEVGLQKILQLLSSEDPDVQIHAVKVVANLAAEDINQEKIVEEGGLDALLMLLESSLSTTILRVSSGAIANLAMNEMNQGLIINKGGAQLLAKTASKTNDPQTLRMVAGALANLCGNENFNTILIEDGAIKALLGMVRCESSEVIAQIGRGIANFAKCETRRVIQGHKKGRSLLIEDGALTWLVANLNTSSASTKRHIELALCHLAQNEDNAKDFIYSGGLKELVRISAESTKEDIRSLAKKTLNMNSTFKAEMQSRK